MIKLLFISSLFLFSCGSGDQNHDVNVHGKVSLDLSLCNAKMADGTEVYNTADLKRACIDKVLDAIKCVKP